MHTTPAYTSLAVLRGGDVIFFRNRGEETEHPRRRLPPTAMYYEDRLNGVGFTRVLLAGGASVPAAPRVAPESRGTLRVSVEAFDPRGLLACAIALIAAPNPGRIGAAGRHSLRERKRPDRVLRAHL